MKTQSQRSRNFSTLAFDFDSAADDPPTPEDILSVLHQVLDLSGSIQLKLRLAHNVLSHYFRSAGGDQ